MIIYHRIKDYINPRTQNIILYIIYNIIRVIIKSLSQIKDLIKNLRIIEPSLLKSSDSRQSFYNNLRILS
nr:MAG TPA: hypothetical protein [Caudoviricetes sp.]